MSSSFLLKSRSNVSEMFVLPWLLRELIDVMPEIVAKLFSSGVATEDAMVSGLAPGRLALTWMVG